MHNLIKKTARTTRMSTSNIGLIVYTEDKAVYIAADNTTSTEEAYRVAIDIAVAITTAMAQIKKAYEEVTVKIKKEIKIFSKRNAIFAINLNAGLTSIQ